MTNPARNLVFILILSALAPAFAAAAPVSPRAELKQLVAELQTSPDNRALREKIIKLALTLKPAPAVPEEAERRMARGAAAIEGASSAEGFADAVAEFKLTVNAAPWLAAGYFNLAAAQEKAGRPAEALMSLKLYLLAAPDAKDAEAVRAKVYKLEYAAEKAAKGASPEAQRSKAERESGQGSFSRGAALQGREG